MIDDCIIGDTPDVEFCRQLAYNTFIGVKLMLKNAFNNFKIF